MFRQLIFTLLTLSVSAQFRYESVYYPGIQSLTFHKGQYTTYRRTSSGIPQLLCHPGDGLTQKTCDEFGPSVVRCTNTGKDDNDQITWECKADLGDHFKFGRTSVSCEGYQHPDDPSVLKGSCGLEYVLELTTAGKDYMNRKQHVPRQPYVPRKPLHPSVRPNRQSDSDLLIGCLIVLMILLWIWNMCNTPVHHPTPPVRTTTTTTTTTSRKRRAPLMSDSDPDPSGETVVTERIEETPVVRRRRNATTTTTTTRQTIHRPPPPQVIIPPPPVVVTPRIIPGPVRPAVIPAPSRPVITPVPAPTSSTPPGGDTRTATAYATTNNR